MRSDGRADPDRRRLRGRRRDRDAGDARGGAGFDVAIVSIDKDFFQLVARRQSRSTTRARTARGSTAQGVVQKFGVQAGAGRRRAGARRRHQRQRGRRARASARRARSISSRSSAASTRCSNGVGELKPKQREALTTHRDDALRSRELVTIRTDVPLDVDFDVAALPRRRRVSGATSCSPSSAFRTLVNDYAPTGGHTSQKDYALVTTAGGARRADRRAAAAGRVRDARHSRRRLGDARGDRRPRVFRPRDRAGAVRADRPRERGHGRRSPVERGGARRSCDRRDRARAPASRCSRTPASGRSGTT